MLCKMNVMARNVLLYLQKCCFMWNFTTNSSSHIHQYSLFHISELTWNKPLNCQVFTTSASSPEGRAPVRRKATTKWTGRATWRPTLPGYGSTWASLAGSCTTGRIPTWPAWLTTWQRSASSVLVSKWGAGGGVEQVRGQTEGGTGSGESLQKQRRGTQWGGWRLTSDIIILSFFLSRSLF